MDERHNLNETGEHIERLLDDLRAMSSPPVRERVDEVVRSILRLYGEGLDRIMSMVRRTESEKLTAELAQDSLVASLLILHGLHPQSMDERVQMALARVRPYLGSHGGDIEVLAVDDQTGFVKLRMKGSCDGCPSSLLTVKLAVETAIRELAPEAATIEVDGITGVSVNGENAKASDAESTSWISLAGTDFDDRDSPFMIDVMNARVMMCRVDGRLYAYCEHCPSCGPSLANAKLDGKLLQCPACSTEYDVKMAGRAKAGGELHLGPVPLLEDSSGVQIALSPSPQ
jgi:Fe-S cluster biogenesis protein NfuA/nitrite reductase/ring-hydroxylating ferredoxin subunit